MFKDIIKKGDVYKGYSAKKLTSFKIGGKIKYVVAPYDEQELVMLMQLLITKNIPYFILGNGTNVLALDKGYSGVVVLTKHLNYIRKISDNVVRAYCGAHLSALCNFCLKNNLSGMEYAYGIPASVGGATKMNAGAYEFEMSKVVKGVLCLQGCKLTYMHNSECDFDYRHSVFNKNNIVIFTDFELKPVKDATSIEINMHASVEKRKLSQPLHLPSAGSVFKRKQGVIVSKLIDELGLKGLRVNDAIVSNKHAGFILNCNKAKCNDVLNLIDIITKKVEEQSGVKLEREIEILE